MENIELKIGEKEYLVSFVENDFNQVIINNKLFQVELLKKYDENIFSFSVNQKLMQVELDFSDDDNIIIAFEGFAYEIKISNETKKLLEKFINNNSSHSLNANYNIKAPMPGMIVKILVRVGQEIEKGEQLIIIEAMKMENALKAQVDSKVKSINVQEGFPVDKDAILIELEPL